MRCAKVCGHFCLDCAFRVRLAGRRCRVCFYVFLVCMVLVFLVFWMILLGVLYVSPGAGSALNMKLLTLIPLDLLERSMDFWCKDSIKENKKCAVSQNIEQGATTETRQRKGELRKQKSTYLEVCSQIH